jgi:TRAP-type C4-dicarboxylate transport system substrate-binding protein
MFADELEKAANGRVKVTLYGSGSLVGLPDAFDATIAGTCDISQIDPISFPDRFPISSVLGLPHLWETAEQGSQAGYELYSKFKEFQDELAGVRVLYYMVIDAFQCLHSSKTLTKTLEDAEGQKVTMSSWIGVECLKALGMVPVSMPPGDRYTSLERGVIDGVITGYEGNFAFGTHQVTKYRTENVNLSAMGTPLVYSVEWYNSLPEDVKQIFDEVADGLHWSKVIGETFDGGEAALKAETLKYDEEVGNPAPYALTEEQQQEWLELLMPIRDNWVNEMEANGVPGEAMLEEAIALAEKYK